MAGSWWLEGVEGAEALRGKEHQLTGLSGFPRRGGSQTEAEAERKGAREGPPRAHGKAREPPPPSEPPFFPPWLPATDGAAGGMTGNSWARAAESKYEQRRRAREDRGARRPRTGPAARALAAANSLLLRFPPTPARPAFSTGARRPRAAKSAREVESLSQGHPFPTLSRAKHPHLYPHPSQFPPVFPPRHTPRVGNGRNYLQEMGR